MEKGQVVFITENARVKLGLPDGLEFIYEETLEQKVEYPIVLKCEELGKDWVEFFCDDEIIITNQ